MNEQEVEKPTMHFLKALILADAMGPEYRACLVEEYVDRASDRCRWDKALGYIGDDGKAGSSASLNRLARIYRPAKRLVSLIEALAWAAEDESRTFHHEGFRCRVSGGLQFQFQGRELDWRDTDATSWRVPCTIDEGWEDVTAQVRVVVE
jgi:hypothetical protein